MINKFRTNFLASSIIVKLLFVVVCSISMFPSVQELALAMYGQLPWYVAALAAMMVSIVFVFISPWLIGLILNFAKLYNVPKAEYVIIALAFCCINYGIRLIGALLTLIWPHAGVWILIVFNFVALLVAMILFYAVTAKFYFNDLTKPYYAKVMLLVFVVLAVVGVI